MGRPIKNLLGKKFGYWKVLNFSYIDKKSHNAYWACKCDICKRIYAVRSDHLQSGCSTKCKKCAYRTRRGKYARLI